MSFCDASLSNRHDRTFLDAVVNHIAHIEHGGFTVYSGNYSAFEVQRAA